LFVAAIIVNRGTESDWRNERTNAEKGQEKAPKTRRAERRDWEKGKKESYE
jgi:hypothetical protein